MLVDLAQWFLTRGLLCPPFRDMWQGLEVFLIVMMGWSSSDASAWSGYRLGRSLNTHTAQDGPQPEG